MLPSTPEVWQLLVWSATLQPKARPPAPSSVCLNENEHNYKKKINHNPVHVSCVCLSCVVCVRARVPVCVPPFWWDAQSQAWASWERGPVPGVALAPLPPLASPAVFLLFLCEKSGGLGAVAAKSDATSALGSGFRLCLLGTVKF